MTNIDYELSSILKQLQELLLYAETDEFTRDHLERATELIENVLESDE